MHIWQSVGSNNGQGVVDTFYFDLCTILVVRVNPNSGDGNDQGGFARKRVAVFNNVWDMYVRIRVRVPEIDFTTDANSFVCRRMDHKKACHRS